MAIDGNQFVWFLERFTSKVAKVDPQTAAITEFDVPTKDANLRRMATDVDATFGSVSMAEWGSWG